MTSITTKQKMGFIFGAIFAFLWFAPQVQAQTSAPQLDIPGLVRAVNRDRELAGLPPLRRDPVLDKAAAAKAADMVNGKYFAHNSPTGTTPWHWFQEAEYDYLYAGENLALDFSSADAAQAAWMKSPKHRANILNEEYEDVGYAIAYGTFDNINGERRERQGIIIVQLFGKRLPTVLAQTNTAGTTPSTISQEPILSPVSSLTENRAAQRSNLVTQALSSLSHQLVAGNFEASNQKASGRIRLVAGQTDDAPAPPWETWPLVSFGIASLMITAGFHSKLMI